jgi:predicted nucleic acid-binding protein
MTFTKITPNKKWAFDSNILVYSLDEDSPFFQKTKALYRHVLDNNIQPVVATQNITETTNVLCKYYKVEIQTAAEKISDLIDTFSFQVIQPKQETHTTFFQLLSRYSTHLQIYDTFLAATLINNGIQNVITCNEKDFAHCEELTVVNPYEPDA